MPKYSKGEKNSWIKRNPLFSQILYSQTVLYLVFVGALANLYILVSAQDWVHTAIFILSGYLTSFFSKNMIVIMCVAIAVTAILKMGDPVDLRREGFTDDVEESTTTTTTVIQEGDEKDPTDSITYLEETDSPKKKKVPSPKDAKSPKDTVAKSFNDIKKSYTDKIQAATEKINNANEIDNDMKDNLKGLLDTQLKLLTGISEIQPLFEKTIDTMDFIKNKVASAVPPNAEK
jgi:hypothetical protein